MVPSPAGAIEVSAHPWRSDTGTFFFQRSGPVSTNKLAHISSKLWHVVGGVVGGVVVGGIWVMTVGTAVGAEERETQHITGSLGVRETGHEVGLGYMVGIAVGTAAGWGRGLSLRGVMERPLSH